MSKLKWYCQRLRAMSIAEVAWRVRQKSEQTVSFRKYSKQDWAITRRDLLGSKSEVASGRRFIPEAFYVDLEMRREEIDKNPDEAVLEYADRICRFEVSIFGGMESFDGGFDWMSSLSDSGRWPLTFSPRLQFRQRDDIGDARVNWELNRHFQTVVLARAYYESSDSKYIDAVRRDFYDWVEKNPFMKGISWTSPMEIAIRAYSWAWAYAFLYSGVKDEDESLLEDMKCAVLNQAEYVMEHRSGYSSANNHLIVEMSLVCIIGMMFGIKSWVDESVQVLSAQIKRQVHEDGVDKEQSMHYHSFVLEAYMLCAVLWKKNSIQYPRHVDEIMDRMCLFIMDMMDEAGGVPEIGDSDEGRLLYLSGPDGFNHYEYVLQGCSALLGRQYVQMDKLQPGIKWIFESEQLSKPLERLPKPESTVYGNGGYTIIRGGESEAEMILTFDHGQLGFGSIAAHGHADALGITLRVGSKTVFADPGTYVYHIKREWRDYFRRTANHNTVEIDGRDQSEIKGEFLWGKKAQSQLLGWSFSGEEDFVSARHYGYQPVIHQRDIVCKKPYRIDITDRISGGACSWMLTFVLGLGVKAYIASDKAVRLEAGEGIAVDLNFEAEGGMEIGIEDGWISPVYMEKRPAKLLRCKGKALDEAGETVKTFIKVDVNFKNQT